MQFKLVPEPPADLETIAEFHDAVPLVPGGEDDCCARILRRTDATARDEARTWLTFLRALELAREGPTGFSRVRREPDAENLREAFRERVYGVDRLLEIIESASGPVTAEAAFERFREDVPQYERHRYDDRADEIWRERVERLLEWSVLFGLTRRADGGYEPA